MESKREEVGVYERVKQEWGFEEYLEGVAGEGEILMTRFRSGSAGIGEEMKRWGRRGEGVWEEDGTERRETGECRACERGCLETLQHLLLEREVYAELRAEWWEVVRTVMGEEEIGEEGFTPLELMLGWRHPSISEDGRLKVLVASTRLFAKLWSARTNLIHGQRSDHIT